MNRIITSFVLVSLFVLDAFAEVCYEYKNSNTRAFECSDGCCGSRTDAYCCMSPILIVGIVVGALAGIIIIAVIIFICFQKYKQRQFNKIMKIEIDQTDVEPTPRKSKKEKKEMKEKKKHAKGGMVSTVHGNYYNTSMTTNGIGGYHDESAYYKKDSLFPDYATYPPPPPPCPRTGTWLLNTNNTAKQEITQLPPPPPPVPGLNIQRANNATSNAMGPLGDNTTSTAAVFNIPVSDTLPAHPGAAELYAERAPIRPLPSSLPPLPPLKPIK